MQVPHRLADCPATRNCVSSQASDPGHRVAPLEFSGSPTAAMERATSIVLSMPGAKLLTASDSYLHARVATRWLRFVDNLELLVDPDAGLIHVRSASRVGAWDLGANRRRVEWLRKRFVQSPPAAPRS